ncbi:hypothetical protein BV898_06627 [Hypsibius exemplaris]|uniref:Insulin-like domain-containing protein n=1 Tax=Hypsibius exemplaris TaxID=2072580 RepID=A0A1W0WW60_HYPEX|nr:hypothetical protein BV898_06627 [Hypsibius exemplaris]
MLRSLGTEQPQSWSTIPMYFLMLIIGSMAVILAQSPVEAHPAVIEGSSTSSVNSQPWTRVLESLRENHDVRREKRSPRVVCGSKLADLLSMVCHGRYNSPTRNGRRRRSAISDEWDPETPISWMIPEDDDVDYEDDMTVAGDVSDRVKRSAHGKPFKGRKQHAKVALGLSPQFQAKNLIAAQDEPDASVRDRNWAGAMSSTEEGSMGVGRGTTQANNPELMMPRTRKALARDIFVVERRSGNADDGESMGPHSQCCLKTCSMSQLKSYCHKDV